MLLLLDQQCNLFHIAHCNATASAKLSYPKPLAAASKSVPIPAEAASAIVSATVCKSAPNSFATAAALKELDPTLAQAL